jgi:hypothetical protein
MQLSSLGSLKTLFTNPVMDPTWKAVRVRRRTLAAVPTRSAAVLSPLLSADLYVCLEIPDQKGCAPAFAPDNIRCVYPCQSSTCRTGNEVQKPPGWLPVQAAKSLLTCRAKFPVVKEKAYKLAEQLVALGPNQPFEMQDVLLKTTLDVIAAAGFEIETKALDISKPNEFLDLLHFCLEEPFK